jgi:hypothetical protein
VLEDEHAQLQRDEDDEQRGPAGIVMGWGPLGYEVALRGLVASLES